MPETSDQRPTTVPVPTPDASGVEPTQATATESDVLLPEVSSDAGGIAPYELSDTLKTLSGIRGEAAIALLSGHAVRFEADVHQLRSERNAAQKEAAHLREELQKVTTEAAVLRERLQATKEASNLRTILTSSGTLFLGVFLPLLIQSPPTLINGFGVLAPAS